MPPHTDKVDAQGKGGGLAATLADDVDGSLTIRGHIESCEPDLSFPLVGPSDMRLKQLRYRTGAALFCGKVWNAAVFLVRAGNNLEPPRVSHWAIPRRETGGGPKEEGSRRFVDHRDNRRLPSITYAAYSPRKAAQPA